MDQAQEARYKELKQKRDSGSITQEESKELETTEKNRNEQPKQG